MSKRDLQRIEVLTEVLAGRRTTESAAAVMDLSVRQTQRLLTMYRDGGAALIHGSRGRPASNSLSAGIRDYMLELVRQNYRDFGPTLAAEVLLERNGIEVSRWFTGLGFDQEVSDHSTFSKNRHGRFQESKVFEQMFEKVVAQCLSVGLVRGEQLSVDGTFVEANASKESRVPREQLAEAAQVNRTVREYLAELEIRTPIEEPTHSQDKVSTTDPDSTYATKGGTPARMGYYRNYLIDNESCIVVGVQATGARLSEECRAAEDMIARFTQWQGRKPESIAADASYGNGKFLQWLMDREIKPYMPTRDAVGRTRSLLFGPESFTYLPESNSYICPAGQQLNYGGRNESNRTFGYIGTRKECGPCEQRSQCTTGPFRYVAIHMNETARQRARDLRTTPEYGQAQRQRKKVEALFAELKSHSHIGVNRLRLRRLKFVREQFFLAATAHNIKRLVRFLSQPTMSPVSATS